MKKYMLVFAGFIYAGGFADLDNAANACSPGSGKLFTETHNEDLGDHVSFPDANGDQATIVPGDAIKPVYVSGEFKGYLAVDATDVAEWQEVPTVAAPAATTDGSAAAVDATAAQATEGALAEA